MSDPIRVISTPSPTWRKPRIDPSTHSYLNGGCGSTNRIAPAHCADDSESVAPNMPLIGGHLDDGA